MYVFNPGKKGPGFGTCFTLTRWGKAQGGSKSDEVAEVTKVRPLNLKCDRMSDPGFAWVDSVGMDVNRDILRLRIVQNRYERGMLTGVRKKALKLVVKELRREVIDEQGMKGIRWMDR